MLSGNMTAQHVRRSCGAPLGGTTLIKFSTLEGVPRPDDVLLA